MESIQWIVFCRDHRWWSCFGSTKEDCLENFGKLFPNDIVVAICKAKDIEKYRFIENKG